MNNLEKYTKIEEVSWYYTLFMKEEEYIMEIICGSSAYYSIYICLTSNEIFQYSSEGKLVLEEIAARVRENPKEQRSREIKTIHEGYKAEKVRENCE